MGFSVSVVLVASVLSVLVLNGIIGKAVMENTCPRNGPMWKFALP